MTTLPQLRRALLAAVERHAAAADAARPAERRARPWVRSPLIALAVLLCLAGMAFASGVLPLGSPAPASRVQIFTAPTTGDGALTPGTVRMLPVSAHDPAGGPPWGIREFVTSRGLGCLEVARLVGGRLVAIGQDDAFADDGRYHELSVASGGAGFGDWCGSLDKYNRLYINQTWGEQPASAWQSRCYAPGSPPGGHMRHEPACPLADERNLYFGLLGPDAKSVTYVLAGTRHTLATSGPEGAYLIVTRSTPGQLLTGVGAGGVVPVDGPITEVHYRDGATCHLSAKSWIGGAYACTPSMQVPVGYVAPQSLSYTHQQAQAPLKVELLRAPHGRYRLRLSFRSRVALGNANSGYDFIWYVPRTLHENHGEYRTESDIAAGEVVSTTTCPLPPGRVHGTVSLYEPNETFKKKGEVVYAYKYEKVGVLVAAFSVTVPGAPTHTRPEDVRDESPLTSCSRQFGRPTHHAPAG
ncbi:MAG TPA: hypothetical protein VGN13_06700 [Solirubrobacteraceae bacterium]|jgi:hypothetical protein